MAFHFFHLRYIVIRANTVGPSARKLNKRFVHSFIHSFVILGLNLSPGAVFLMSEKQIMEAFLKILLSGLVQINHMHYVVAKLDFSLH